MAEGGKAFPGSLGNSAKGFGALLTISKKEKKKKRMALADGKKETWLLFGGFQKPLCYV